MNEQIMGRVRAELKQIERTERVTILYAAESGSRAWGFASPDSDYDVRFLYARRRDDYLKLEKQRDVIEWRLDDTLDINGWDISKALRLLHASNATLFEWLQSPIVYRKHALIDDLTPFAMRCFLERTGLMHYLNTAHGNYREYLTGERVRLKKYFYVLRPLLACRHILSEHTPPPMAFSELVETQLEESMRLEVRALILRKLTTPELGEGARIQPLNDYIERSLAELESAVSQLPQQNKLDWQPFDNWFLRVLERAAPAD